MADTTDTLLSASYLDLDWLRSKFCNKWDNFNSSAVSFVNGNHLSGNPDSMHMPLNIVFIKIGKLSIPVSSRYNWIIVECGVKHHNPNPNYWNVVTEEWEAYSWRVEVISFVAKFGYEADSRVSVVSTI
jgi:hypothetical protein